MAEEEQRKTEEGRGGTGEGTGYVHMCIRTYTLLFVA